MSLIVAINGFGRIGRAFLRTVIETGADIRVVAVNDLGDINNLAYLLKYDSVYKKASFDVHVAGGMIVAGNMQIEVLAEKDPTHLPWAKMGIDLVVESTGLFTEYEKAKAHIDAGAKRVVITAPVKGDAPEGITGETVLMGINEAKLQTCNISSNASCTTNGASPLIQILHEAIGIERAVLNTVHGYTASQSIVDSPNKKDFREGRAAAMNIVPASTGAAIAVTKAVTDLAGKFDGISMRVPIVAGSMVDVTFVAKRPTTVEEVNAALVAAAQLPRWSKTFSVTDEPLVSTDILGSPFASIADLKLTRVVDGTLVKVMAWYDNEAGYAHALVHHVVAAGKYLG